MKQMDENDLRRLISEPESDTLEFKASLPNTDTLVKALTAFANTLGGVLLIGVKDNGEIKGVDNVARILQMLDSASKKIYPKVEIAPEVVSIDNKTIVVVKIAQGKQLPYLGDGLAFQRSGARTIPITSNILTTHIQEQLDSNTIINLDILTDEIKRLSKVIQTMNLELLNSRRLRPKLADMVLGGIIGALVSIAFALLLKLG